jgi:hypothetical protein
MKSISIRNRRAAHIKVRGKITRFSVQLLLFLCSWALALNGWAQDSVKEQLVVPLSNPGKPGSLEVGLLNGSIRVIGYEGKEVVIDAVTRAGKKRNSDDDEAKPAPGGMRKISSGHSFELTAEERNNRVEVNSDSWKRSVDLTIKVPRQFSLKLSTVNHGDIEVENVSGQMEVNNVNGSIELKNVSGSAVANTVNGKLIATFREIAPDAPMAFSTLNGAVDVTFPGNAKLSTKMKSERGEIYSDFDMAVEKSQPKIDHSSKTGTYRISIEDWVQGKINGGGPQVLMKNMNGNIYLRKAK